MTYRLECVSNCKSGITHCAIEFRFPSFRQWNNRTKSLQLSRAEFKIDGATFLWHPESDHRPQNLGDRFFKKANPSIQLGHVSCKMSFTVKGALVFIRVRSSKHGERAADTTRDLENFIDIYPEGDRKSLIVQSALDSIQLREFEAKEGYPAVFCIHPVKVCHIRRVKWTCLILIAGLLNHNGDIHCLHARLLQCVIVQVTNHEKNADANERSNRLHSKIAPMPWVADDINPAIDDCEQGPSYSNQERQKR